MAQISLIKSLVQGFFALRDAGNEARANGETVVYRSLIGEGAGSLRIPTDSQILADMRQFAADPAVQEFMTYVAHRIMERPTYDE